jgi:hypothetical protein
MKYYINKARDVNGENILHVEKCQRLHNSYNREYMGDFETNKLALEEVKKIYPSANGCQYCCAGIHENSYGLMGLYY